METWFHGTTSTEDGFSPEESSISAAPQRPLQSAGDVLQSSYMTQEELLYDIVKRLERMEQGQQTLREDLSTFKQETADNFADLHKSVRGLKLKTSKTWNLLHYFTRDADERVVKTARRVDAIEEHLGLAHKN